MANFDRVDNSFGALSYRFRIENEERRREDRRYEEEDEARDIENEAHDPSKQVKIVSIDFQAKANAANHHCEKFVLLERKKNVSIIRRGGTFTIIVTFNKEVDIKKQQQFKLYLNFGSAPNVHNGTQSILAASGKTMFDKNHETWDIRVAEETSTEITFEVQVPTDAPVGMWKTAAEVMNREDRSIRHLLRLDQEIFILFNPWNKNDATYLPDEEKRQEYVLNDVGRVWQGSYPAVSGRHWVFGQFDDVVLPACVLMLERAGITAENRGDPVRVSRAISKIVNSNDDQGVLVGRWHGSYADGTEPWNWTGSIAILEEYVREGRPVRYGQCWVFAAVVNTVCRALGLPSRVVTNFNSAHDTNQSLTIDEYYDKDGSSLPGPGSDDSIWNYHVWNDVWMTRPDLPDGYGGWQAIDATPQEASDGAYQCGPASHEAIRHGMTHFKYDVPFVLAEVNADVVHWQVDEEAEDGFKRLQAYEDEVGRTVLTRKAGDMDDTDAEEITDVYKPKEGTPAERITLYAAARRTRAARNAYRLPSDTVEDVKFSIVDIERVPIGDDFSITINAKVVGAEQRTISAVLSARSSYYTGHTAYPIASESREFVLQPGEETSISLPVTYDLYYSRLVEYSMVKLVAICNVKETSFAWIGEDKFQILKPDIKIELMSEGVQYKSLTVRFSFTNPLPTTLRNCVLAVEAPGLVRPKTIPLKDIEPKAEMVYEMRFYPRKATDRCTIVAAFNSKELVNVTGSQKVVIAPANG